MIHICSQCGALLLEDAPTCLFCDSPITDTPELAAVAATPDSPPARSAAARSSAPASSIVVEPEWRIEVSRRLAEYRRRRGHLIEDDSQSGLPFAEERVLEDDLDRLPSPTPAEAPRTAGRVSARARQTERLDICVQPELDFSTAASNRARPQTALVPVASLAERRSAAVLDAVFLTLTYAGFVGLFRSLGGQLMFQKIDAAVCLSTLFLFYCLYFSLFTTFAGATPGMMLRGLTIVRLDGSLPDTRQLLWRSFGYMLSSATLFLGFLWALWDEDRFTWQDRISQTYVTSTEPLIHAASLDSPAVRHGFAHK